MFKSIQFTEGFATNLEGIGDRVFEFKPGINVVYGPNGSGKTTILQTLAAYTGLNTNDRSFGHGAGWSRPPKDQERSIGYKEEVTLDKLFVAGSPGKCKANVVWDGMPSFYNSAKLSDTPTMTHFAFGDEAADGIGDTGLQLAMIQGRAGSEGELRKSQIAALLGALDKKPEPYTKPQREEDKVQKLYAEFVKSLSRDGRRTLLWDEPDRSLDAEMQFTFWIEWMPRIMGKFDVQIILSSHSFVPPWVEGTDLFNVIEIQKGKAKTVRNTMLALMNYRLKKEEENEDDTVDDATDPADEVTGGEGEQEDADAGTNALLDMDEG